MVLKLVLVAVVVAMSGLTEGLECYDGVVNEQHPTTAEVSKLNKKTSSNCCIMVKYSPLSLTRFSADDENDDICAKYQNNGCSQVAAQGAWGWGQVVMQCVCDTDNCNDAEFANRNAKVCYDSKGVITVTDRELTAANMPKFTTTCVGQCCKAVSSHSKAQGHTVNAYTFSCPKDCNAGCELKTVKGTDADMNIKECYCSDKDKCNTAEFINLAGSGSLALSYSVVIFQAFVFFRLV